MTDHYNSLETRPPLLRESEEFAALTHAIAHALAAPAWAKQLAGVNPHKVDSREALAKLPVLRKSDIAALQKETPPFGGLNVTPPGKASRLLMSPGPIFEPEGHGKDWYGAARALFAAGFRAGDIVHNCFAYHLTPGEFMIESGAHALGCAVIPGGVGIPSSSSRRSRITSRRAMSARPTFSRSCSIPRRRAARMRLPSSARWCRARRCRPRCARN